MMKLTIITINLNNAQGLCKTVESVLKQTSNEFEYIIIDGGSTDNSLRVISDVCLANKDSLESNGSAYNNGIQIKWISEPDTGIYNAMNKGIRMAKGEYVQFLNSGDFLYSKDVIKNVLISLQNQCDIYVGTVASVTLKGKLRYTKNLKSCSLVTFYGGTLPHTSSFIRRSLFDKYGYYDESLRIVSDWKWYLIVAGLNKSNILFSDIIVSCFDTTGISNTNKALDKLERRRVLEELVPAPILQDYDKYYFDINQIERLKKYQVIYKIVWILERCLFKVEKWRKKFYREFGI